MMARALTSDQLDILRRFLDFEASLEDIRLKLREVREFELSSEDGVPRINCNFPAPEPGVTVARQRLESALQRRQGQHISEQELMAWATRLFFDHPYDWEIEEEDTNPTWLKNISLDVINGDQ